jgi:hypothetical protein
VITNVYEVSWIQLRALCMVGKHSTTELLPQPSLLFGRVLKFELSTCVC